MADTLEENYVLDDQEDHSVLGSDVDAEAVSLGEAESESEEERSEAKESNEEHRNSSAATASNSADEAARKENKKRKRKEKEKARKQKRAALTAEFASGMGSVATQPPDMQADYLSSKQNKTFSKLSELELDEMRLRESMLIDTTAFGPPRVEQHLAEFVQQCIPVVFRQLEDEKHATNTLPGQPSLIVLTGNAQRAADLSRSLRSLGPQNPVNDQQGSSAKRPRTASHQNNTSVKGGSNGQGTPSKTETDASASSNKNSNNSSSFTVAKLFARHFKLKEHEAWLKDHITPLATGTPQRVAALVASGNLKLDSLAAIAIDQTWVDPKQRNVFDTPETRDELIKLLSLDAVREALKRAKSPAKVVLF